MSRRDGRKDGMNDYVNGDNVNVSLTLHRELVYANKYDTEFVFGWIDAAMEAHKENAVQAARIAELERIVEEQHDQLKRISDNQRKEVDRLLQTIQGQADIIARQKKRIEHLKPIESEADDDDNE